MRVLVVGTGSIGSRHIKNLISLGHEVYAVDKSKESLSKVLPLVKGGYLSLTQALKFGPECAFICTYSNSHIEAALRCAESGCHLFIEKPLSLTLSGANELIKKVKEKKLISLVGCNMRFHPAISHIYKLVKTHPAFKKILLADLEFGYYLPFAKPDYRRCYQAQKKLGGNIVFDDIHELDYALWFFGAPKRVFCSKGILSSLKIDTDDHAELIVEFESGTTCCIHLDYLQHGYARACKIVSDQGTAMWDFNSGKVQTAYSTHPKWKTLNMKVELYYNQMYIDEVKYFMRCLQKKADTFNTIEQSVSVIRLALAALRSNSLGKWVTIKKG